MKNENMNCAAASRCGGCVYIQKTYREQVSIKQKEIQKLLGCFGRISPVLTMEDPYYYRNKVHRVIEKDKKGNVIAVIYEENSHRAVPVQECLIEDRKCQEIILTICGMLKSFKIKTYDEDMRYGLLRHVLVRRGFATGEVMVVLVVSSPIFPSKNNFVKALRLKHPEITTIVLNINDKRTSMVLGERNIVLYGSGYITDRLSGFLFRISPSSFFQVNPVQTEKLYGEALRLAGLTGKETVLDAYCGIGTIGIIASKSAAHVLSVELNEEAVRDAKLNIRLNKADNVRVFNEDAGHFMEKLSASGEKPDVVFMDPPRSGSDRKFLDSLLNLSPACIVYISCNPVTLARDLRYLTKNQYTVQTILPVEMFPFTQHVETVCLLSNTQRPKKESYITLDVEMEDYYRIKNEGKNSTT